MASAPPSGGCVAAFAATPWAAVAPAAAPPTAAALSRARPVWLTGTTALAKTAGACALLPPLPTGAVPRPRRRHGAVSPFPPCGAPAPGGGGGPAAPLSMMFESLAEKMDQTVRKLRGTDKITEANIGGALKEVRRAMLDADVNLRVVDQLIGDVRERAVGSEVVAGVEPGQQFIKIIYEELTRVMGKDAAPLARRAAGSGPTVVLLAGLQGAGKTTAAAKLALYVKSRKGDKPSVSAAMLEKAPPSQPPAAPAGPPPKVLLVACDVYRPAAVEQLQTLAGMIDVDVYTADLELGAVEIARRGLTAAEEGKYDTVIIDTAGRQVINDKLMRELRDVKAATRPDDTLLVVDAMTGQEAANLTRAFNDSVGITGAILTKLDGDTRGGAALSVQSVSGKPIKFVGTGEKVEKLEPFFPERMASRILGMGDVLTLVDKAEEAMDVKEAEALTKRMVENTFDFEDFLKQSKMINTMGSFGGLMKMLPGVGSISGQQMAQAEQKLKLATCLINSMTVAERRQPDLLASGGAAASRLGRIARGSGRSVADAKTLVSDFQRMRTMMAKMSKKMMAEQGGGPGGPDGPGGGGPPSVNRAQRRKASKKKAQSAPKRGFGK